MDYGKYRLRTIQDYSQISHKRLAYYNNDDPFRQLLGKPTQKRLNPEFFPKQLQSI